MSKIDEWVQADTRVREDDDQCECGSTKQREARHWNRTVFVPEAMQPIDIITTYSRGLPLPPFHAGQPSVNKHDVECIASAMMDPNLRWRNMYNFLIAPYDGQDDNVGGIFIDQGEQVLITGHHRFLAWLLVGAPPSRFAPLHVRTAPMSVIVFPWSMVEWGA